MDDRVPPNGAGAKQEAPPRAAASTAGHALQPVAAPSPSLPKGGGAIRGLGEKHAVSAATGTGSLAVPIGVSPARGGFQPSLSLEHDSGAGNGAFGLGWRLAVGEVTRRTDKGLPQYGGPDGGDVFILSGMEDLVPVRGADGAIERLEEGDETVERYRPRTEGAFARIERRWKAGGALYWKVVSRDDVTSVYGRSEEARLADPAAPGRVFSWLLEEMRDDRGNVIVFEYKAEDLRNVPRSAPHELSRHGGQAPITNRYLKRIRYGNTAAGDPSTALFEVVLDYGEHDEQTPTPEEVRAWPCRQDPFSHRRAGFEIRTYRLCRRVLMFHHLRELGDGPCLVQSTDLTYAEDPVATRLTAVTRSGYKRDPGSLTYAKKSYPALELGYSLPEIRTLVQELDRGSAAELGSALGGAHRWTDLDGEGLSGLLTREAGALFYRPNLGDGKLGPARPLPTRPSLSASRMQVADIDGDGRKEMVFLEPPMAGYHERTEEGSWAPFVPFASQPEVDWSDPNLQLIDLSGDGRDDLLLARGETLVWYRSLGKGGFDRPITLSAPRDDGNRTPVLVFASATERLFLADMSGDGLMDLVRIRNGSVCYWPNLGYGRFGARVEMTRAPWLDHPDQFDLRRVRLADVDGSGTTDLVYLRHDSVRIYTNQSGNGFGPAIELPGLPDHGPMSTVEVFDLLGTGTACLVWSSPLPGFGAAPVRYIDLLGGEKPYLLTSVRNNLGLETRVRYAPSTRFYLADRAAGRLWVTRLPFPVHVVERVETYDHVSRVRLVSEYRYHHGHYDGHEREFRGFGMVEQVDTEAFSAHLGQGLFPEVTVRNGELPQPPVVTKTWFHTGAWARGAAISRQYEKEYYALDPEAPRLPDTLLEAGLSAEERQQACRALRGQVLRQEVYALDGSPAERHPYSVTEKSFAVRRVEPARGASSGVFLVVPREAIALVYERYRDAEGRLDPRVTQEFTLEVDVFGAVRKSATVAYPRRRVPSDPDLAAQGRLLATLIENDVVHLDSKPEGYRLGIPIETRTYELEGLVAPREGLSFEAMSRAAAGAGASVVKRLIQQQRFRYYDSASLPSPLPFGSADVLALPYERYTLALTAEQIAQTFNAGQERVTPAVLAEGGYVQLPGDSGFWIPSGRLVFDPSRFYLPVSAIDPFGATSTVAYDAYALLVTRTEDALGNQVQITNDYRVLSPAMITDANGNRASVQLDELGMVVAEAVMGKEGSADGDTLEDPTAVIRYALFEFRDAGRPSFAHVRRRERHGNPSTRWLETWVYSDGGGHEILRKERAEPGPVPLLDAEGRVVREADGQPRLVRAESRWVGSGRAVFDNKGNPIKKYESYFSHRPEYDPEEELAQWGVTPILRYDPLGRAIRVDLPNGTSRRVEFTPWEQTSWDENDTVLEPGNLWHAARQPGATPAASAAEQRAARLAATHAGTPAVEVLDPLGRAFVRVTDLGGGRRPRTRVTLDIEGQELVVTDARGNDAMVRTFDVAGRAIHQKSIDAGERWMLLDVVGNPLRRWDSRGHRHRSVYDVLRRRTELWVQAGAGAEALVERTVYGEQHAEAAALNLRGRVHQHYDGAGVTTNEAFDFKGNLLSSTRRLAADHRSQPDWSRDPAPALQEEEFRTSAVFDALSRPTRVTTPDGSETLPRYNEAGLLDAVDVKPRWAVASTPMVTDVAYNAKGQRERIEFGNGVATDTTYDPLSFRLRRIRTVRASDNAVLQDLGYTHDPVGNIVEIADRAQKTVHHNNQVVEPVSRYEYDALYRLRRAEGREHAGQNADVQQDERGFPLVNAPHPNDPQALRNYTERYEYDDVGNILAMIHQAGSGSWTRRYEVAQENNRLLSTSLPRDPEAGPYSAKYGHDAHGNMTSMPHLSRLVWDEKDQMREVDLGGGGKVYFVYDAAGERVRKVWEHSGIIEERVYLGGYEVYRRREGAAQELVLERQTLHVMDGGRRIALVETKTVDTSGPFTVMPRLRYQHDNHLGSASLEVDGAGLVIGYEEYHPYGTTAYWSASSAAEVSRRRYQYTGKEKDEETGLYYHGARYYAPWLGRWTAADPAGIVDGPNLYSYVMGNPVRLIDPSGMASDGPNYGLEALQRISAVNAAALGLKVATEEEKNAQLAEAKKTPAKVTKAPALPVQEIRPEHPLAGDMEKVRRAAELSSIPPEQGALREAAARHLRYGPVEAVLVEGEAAKERIEATIESLEAKEASIHGDEIKIQVALERQGVLPPRLTGPKGAILPGPIERDPAGGYRPVPTAGPARAGVGGLINVRGTLTETAPASRGERAFAQEFFVSKGYDVRLAGLGTEGADLNVSVGGVPIGRFELKQQTTGNPSNVAKRIRTALRQAPNAIIDLRQSPLSNVGAIGGYKEAARKGWVPQGATVRIITPNMDITFGRR
ncbi:SpvB/TcaC N-terminal domain-containing protein [Sorangium sp. So ce233]|uniref:SpvB/TcaC N-terminal domain-containing protein n=1 Tax=Sorangium sp. So ce233 TaxID=3133290 RepID=UPI003F6296B0